MKGRCRSGGRVSALGFFLAAIAGSAPVRGQVGGGGAPSSFTVAVGDEADDLAIYVVEEDGSAIPFPASGENDFSLMPIDLAGRLEIRRFDPARPRRAVTDDGQARILLPGGTSVFHYRRGAVYGFLAVGPDALPRILIELPATGIPFFPDPFLRTVAGSSDGARLAVATRPQAGGDLWLLSIDGSLFPDGTEAFNAGGTGVLEVDARSLTFADGALFFTVGGEEVYRAPTDGTGPATPLPLPPSGGSVPDEVVREIAVSEDGSTLAFVAGEDDEERDIYVLTPPSGSPANLTQDPGEYLGPGYQPAFAHGPTLALSPDGSTIAYLKEVDGEEELYVRPTAGGPPVHVTPDPIFEPYIDSVVIISIGYANEVEFAAGGEGALGGNPLEQLDYYRASVGPGNALTVTNLTATNGATSPPFLDAASLSILDAFELPGNSGKGMVSLAPGGVALRLLNPTSATATVAYQGQTWDADGVGPAGGRLVFPARGPSGLPELVVIEGGATPNAATLASGPTWVSVASLAFHPSGTEVALVASATNGSDMLVQVEVPGGQVTYTDLPSAAFSRTLAYSPLGLPGFALGPAAAGPYDFGLLGPGGPLALQVPAGIGSFLR